jgi:outer membrane biosynthesis protein TonB
MKKISLICLLLYACSTYTVFDYDRAVSCGKKGNWERAASLLNNVTTDRPDIVYDKGVVAHHQKNFSTAKECFLSAACHPEADATLCERAHFNVGNACFALKDLEGAREQYKKVLALNQNNSFAQHNLKRVEEMLKKQQEEQKKEDEEKEQDEKEQQQDDNKKQQDAQQKKNSDKEKQKKEQSSDYDEHKKQPEPGDDEKEQTTQQQQSKNEQSEGKQPQQQQEQRDEKGKKEEGAGAEANNKKRQQQQQGTQGQQKKDPATHDAWLEGLLEKSDKRDAQGNKKMIKAMVQQQMGGNEGQNCW